MTAADVSSFAVSVVVLQWKAHRVNCQPPASNESSTDHSPSTTTTQTFMMDYDNYIKQNNEMLCFAVFRALYHKLRSHVAFLRLQYHPDTPSTAGNKFTVLVDQVEVQSLQDMLRQSERNVAISKNVSENLSKLHTQQYTVGICIVEVVGDNSSVGAVGGAGEPWARMEQFSREAGLSEASVRVSVEQVLARINEGYTA